MSNTVIFQTQREDGTWKTWRNVVIPVKFGTLLDEQLDYAVVSLARIKRKEFKPMTRATLTVTSNTQYGGEQTKVIQYLIANDDNFETPIGSGEYNHELTLIELTKFLECFPLESLCFTNPNGNDYTRVRVVADLTSEALRSDVGSVMYEWIDREKFKSYAKTPAIVGSAFHLIDLMGAGLGSTDGLDKTIVTVTNKNGSFEFDSTDYDFGTTFSNASFEVAEGANEVTYLYRPTAMPPGRDDAYGYEKFTIYGVNNKYPLKPWTVNDVIQRVLQLVEPLLINNPEKQRFRFTPPTDSKARLFSQFAPEFTFTRMTLREALQTIGGFIHAEPRLDEYNRIRFDYYGEQEYATIYNYRTQETKRLSETKYRANQGSYNVEQACTKLDSYQENLVNRLAWEQATTAQPFKGGGKPFKGGRQTLRTETAYIRGEEESSFYLPTVQGIDRIVSLEYIDDNGTAFDITPFVFEESVYNNLSSYSGAYPVSKSYALYYSQNGKGINGFFFKAPSAFGGGIGQNYAIVNILNSVKATYGDYDKMKFCLTYVPIYSTRIQQSKQHINEYLPLPRVLNYTQTDNSVETRFFGENIKGAVARMGNPEKVFTINLRNVNNIPIAGQLWDDDYYIASVSVAVNEDIFEVSVGLSKNFNRKSQYIGASSIKRIYEVSETMVQQRHTIYNDYIVLTKDLYTDIALVNNVGLFLNENGLKAISYIFTPAKYFTVSEISSVYAIGVTKQGQAQEPVLLPVISSAFGNAMEFTWEYKDNFSAGLQSVEATSDEVTGAFGKEVEYTDYYGRLWGYAFSLMSQDQASALAYDPALLPEIYSQARESMANVDEANMLLERKDGREALKKSYAVEFVTDEPTFIIGSAFAGKNPLVYRNPLTWNPPKLYIFPKRLNKFASHIDFDGATDLGWANDPKYTETPVPHFSIAGKTATVAGQAWAYVIPIYNGQPYTVETEDGNVEPITPQLGGELIVGENIDFAKGDTIGQFNGLAIHDIFEYLRFK